MSSIVYITNRIIKYCAHHSNLNLCERNYMIAHSFRSLFRPKGSLLFACVIITRYWFYFFFTTSQNFKEPWQLSSILWCNFNEEWILQNVKHRGIASISTFWWMEYLTLFASLKTQKHSTVLNTVHICGYSYIYKEDYLIENWN